MTATLPNSKPADQGLFAWLGETRIHLPLIHIETRFRVTGGVAAVEMDQVFEQTSQVPLDVTYTFPLPGQAAVYRCEMVINGRVIRAVVMEEAAARKTVEEQKAKGRRTALVEMDRDNLFTLELGNVAPGDRIVIRFAYFEQLDRLGGLLSLRIPFSPGVRYIPGKPLLRENRGRGTVDDTDQVPDASRLTPPRIDGSHPDAATMYLHGEFDEGEADMDTLASPTHPAVFRKAEGRVEVELCGEENYPANDFVLRWQECATTGPATRTWACASEGQLYALLQLRAPGLEAVPAHEDFAQDIYFLVDRSGSMSGEKWEKCAIALQAFVRELGPNDRVWITCFESNYLDFAERPMMRDELLADRGFQTLGDIGTAGGTELLPALDHVLEVRKEQRSERPARIILITDGQVGNESAVLSRMRKSDAADTRVHCFGIDHAVNDAFLKSLARQTAGRCALLTPQDDIPDAVRRLAQTIRRPILTGLSLQEGLVTTEDSAVLPDLHAGEVTLLAVRTGTKIKEAIIRGLLPDGQPWTQRLPINAAGDLEAPRLLWARRRCLHLLESGKKNEAVALAVEHNVVCQGTSFVAYDEAEKVSVAARTVYQPSMAPGGGSMLCASPALCAMPSAAALGGASGRPLFKKVLGGAWSRVRRSKDGASFAPDASVRSRVEEACQDLGAPDPYEMEEPPSRPPTRQELLAQDILTELGELDELALIKPLDHWARNFRDELVAAGTPVLLAAAMAMLLRNWANEFVSRVREGQLRELLQGMIEKKTRLESLRVFVKQLVKGETLRKMKILLEAREEARKGTA